MGLSIDSIPTEDHSEYKLSSVTVSITFIPPSWWLESTYTVEVKLWKSWDFDENDEAQSDSQEVDWIN
jgi:hypothetical protein